MQHRIVWGVGVLMPLVWSNVCCWWSRFDGAFACAESEFVEEEERVEVR